MWKLVPESGQGEAYHILTGIDYIVGRKNCTILIQDDQSISRVHAVLSLRHSASSLGQPDIISTVIIKDSSKYGTFINETRMENSVPKDLKSGDKVTFGVFNSKYRVEHEPLVTCSSCLNVSEKNALNQSLHQLGGHVVGNWTETCTHLVMTSIKVTIKTICALICCRPIVQPEYFSELINAIKQKQTLPVLTSFIPFIDEPSIKMDSVDLSVNAKRKYIFKDKTFLFLNAKQFKKLSQAIIFGSGDAKLLKEELKDTSVFDNPGTCVIDVALTNSQLSVSESTQAWISSTMDVLQSKDLRAIPEAEIGLAVIYMSTEIYCNPRRSSASGNEIETSKPNIISQSLAVDETVLPAPTLNITAYVANTEPQDETNNWMDISGVGEVKETPNSSRRGNNSKTHPKGYPGNSSDIKVALFQENTKVTEKISQLQSPINEPSKNKERTSHKILPGNQIKNYFQPLSKKRERGDDGNEISSAKLPRVESLASPRSEKKGPILQEPVKVKYTPKSPDHYSDLELEQALIDSEKSDVSQAQPNVSTLTSSMEKDGKIIKRKGFEDDLVEESDIESEEDVTFKSDQNHLKNNNSNNAKRRRTDSENDQPKLKEGENPTKVMCTIKIGLIAHKKKVESPFQTKREGCTLAMEVKSEPESPREQNKVIKEPKILKEYDGLPSKLLLTEFRSLVVSRQTRNSQFKANTNHGNAPNFKKFKKMAYPGAGSFPHIIGGSDLVAHNSKKNSELEQWLRQEVEEQTQQAREESLADDLFRYNPKTVKRRR
ncbi:nibrin [Pelodytes ibericus]